jgi:hypothetical protein
MSGTFGRSESEFEIALAAGFRGSATFNINIPSNNTSVKTFAHSQDENRTDFKVCLPLNGCYGLLDFSSYWFEYRSSVYILRWVEEKLNANQEISRSISTRHLVRPMIHCLAAPTLSCTSPN